MSDGKHFTIISDHRELSYLKTVSHTSARHARWAFLQGYNYTAEYCSGSKKSNADALSRLLPEPSESEEELPPEPIFDLPGEISLVHLLGGMQKFEYHFTNDLGQGYSGGPGLNALEQMTSAQEGYDKIYPLELVQDLVSAADASIVNLHGEDPEFGPTRRYWEYKSCFSDNDKLARNILSNWLKFAIQLAVLSNWLCPFH